MNLYHVHHADHAAWKVVCLLVVFAAIILAEWRYAKHQTGRRRKR